MNDGATIVRIMILEDDPLIAIDLEMIVEEEGHEVVGSFGSLAEARPHLSDGFDFALLDIDVTDGKSFEIAMALIAMRVPFVFVSAVRRSELPDHLQNAFFIPKPYEERVIRRLLEKGLNGVSQIQA
jgi:DNA-binding LytR/AlgR family response regulator